MTAQSPDPDVISTGIDALDDHLGGGIPAGSVIALRSPPESAGEYVAHAIASAPDRQTVYFTTARSADAIEADLETYHSRGSTSIVRGRGSESEEIETESLSVTRLRFSGEVQAARDDGQSEQTVCEVITEALEAFDSSGPAATDSPNGSQNHSRPVLIVDAFSTVLDRTPPDQWKPLLDTISETITKTNGIACLIVHPHGPDRTSDTNHVLQTMDAVLTYEMGDADRPDRLRLHKLRNAHPTSSDLPFTLPLLVEDGIKRNPDERA